MPAITPLPTPPTRADPDSFRARSDAFLSALPDMAEQMNDVAAAMGVTEAPSSGTFTPAFYSSGAVIGHNVQQGFWRVVGFMCFFSLAVRSTGRSGTLSNNLFIDATAGGGLPAPGAAATWVYSTGQMDGFGGSNVVAQGLSAGLIGLLLAGTDDPLLASNMDVAGATLYVSGFYEIDH